MRELSLLLGPDHGKGFCGNSLNAGISIYSVTEHNLALTLTPPADFNSFRIAWCDCLGPNPEEL